MPKNLVEELGSRYMTDYFTGAFFRLEDTLYQFRGMTEGGRALINKVSLKDKADTFTSGYLDQATFKDFTTFKYPKLGYRQLSQGKVGNIVVWISTQRSVQRGLKEEYINIQPLPIFDTLCIGMVQGWHNAHLARRMREVFEPTFIPFSVGIKKLIDGELAAFAINEDLAIGISCSEANRDFDVYFRGRVVGTVDRRGDIKLVNKILQRDSIKKKLFK